MPSVPARSWYQPGSVNQNWTHSFESISSDTSWLVESITITRDLNCRVPQLMSVLLTHRLADLVTRPIFLSKIIYFRIRSAHFALMFKALPTFITQFRLCLIHYPQFLKN